LQTLHRLQGLDFDTALETGRHCCVTVADLLDEVYTKAGKLGIWAVVRGGAGGLRQMVDIGLSDQVTRMLVRGITVGKSYSEASITRPMSNNERENLVSSVVKIYAIASQLRDPYLGLLIQSEPQLFDGLLTLRWVYLILLITSEMAHD